MSGISAIYILDHKGRVLISRHYRGDLISNIHENYNKKVLDFDEQSTPPVIEDQNGNFFFHKRV